MTFPLYDTDNPQDLGYEAKWKTIGDIIDYAITEQITQNETRTYLRAKGFTFGNTPFNQLWQSLADYRVRFNYPTTIPDDILPNINVMYTSGLVSSGVYQYKGWSEWYDESTDSMKSQYFSINSTDLLPKNDALAKLWDFFSQTYGIDAENLEQFYYIGALRGIG